MCECWAHVNFSHRALRLAQSNLLVCKQVYAGNRYEFFARCILCACVCVLSACQSWSDAKFQKKLSRIFSFVLLQPFRLSFIPLSVVNAFFFGPGETLCHCWKTLLTAFFEKSKNFACFENFQIEKIIRKPSRYVCAACARMFSVMGRVRLRSVKFHRAHVYLRSVKFARVCA